MNIDVATSRGLLCSVTVPESATLLDLKTAIAKRKRKYDVTRQRLSVGEGKARVVFLDNRKKLVDLGLTPGSVVNFKDVGPQLWFRTVFFWEYLGPLIIYPLFALRLIPVYGDNPAPMNLTQRIAVICWVVHYTKRELETFLVHEFGDLTMPRRNLFKNSIYYWGFGALVGWWVNRPSCCVGEEITLWLQIGLPMFCLAVLCNGLCHLQLMRLRPKGSSEFVMPHGFLFNFVTAPNYTCEILTWVAFNVMTRFSWAGVAFNCAGALQMNQWAVQKHRRYKKDFPNYPKRRKIFIPLIY